MRPVPRRGCWPPECEMPGCHEPRERNALRIVDFGSAGQRLVALCDAHLRREIAGRRAPRP